MHLERRNREILFLRKTEVHLKVREDCSEVDRGDARQERFEGCVVCIHKIQVHLPSVTAGWMQEQILDCLDSVQSEKKESYKSKLSFFMELVTKIYT